MADCKTCMETKAEEKKTSKEQKDIAYSAFETVLARDERTFKWLIIGLVISVIMIIASNAMWLWYISQYDFESYEVNSADGGNASYVGNDGDIYNGISKSEEAKTQET